MKLTSHGCSFVYGSELSSPSLSWPALIAKKLKYEYHCSAVPGSGNLQIMESVLQHAGTADFCVINWTWIDRFDFVDTADESWHTLRPALDHEHAGYYYRFLHGQYRDILTNLAYVLTAIEFLSDHSVPFVMTYIDYLLFDTVQPEWHQPDAIEYLQRCVRPHMQDFNGFNFLDWSRDQGFAISPSWHPLEQAHAAAADYMMPITDAIRHRA
jgi:hypothetical protein